MQILRKLALGAILLALALLPGQVSGAERSPYFRMLKSRNYCIQSGLARKSGHTSDSGVCNVNSCRCSHKYGSYAVSAGVVGVEMNGNGKLLLQSLNELECSHRLQKGRHILDTQNVGSSLL